MIALVTGCFDRFHGGHAFFLREAKEVSNYLIVAVNSDESVRVLKGRSRPYDPLSTRIRNVRRFLDPWDAVIPFGGNDKDLALAIKPDLIIRGWDQSEKPSPFRVVRIARGPGVSTSSLLK